MIELRITRGEDRSIDVSGSFGDSHATSSGDVIDELAAACATILEQLSLLYEGEDDILGMLEMELTRGIATRLRWITGEAD